MKTFLAFVLTWCLCLVAAVVGLLWMPCSALFGSGRRATRIAVAFDQVGNATGAGDEDESFSARCYRLRRYPRYSTWMQRIDATFLYLKGEKNHCRGAFEAERARRERPYKDQ